MLSDKNKMDKIGNVLNDIYDSSKLSCEKLGSALDLVSKDNIVSNINADQDELLRMVAILRND